MRGKGSFLSLGNLVAMVVSAGMAVGACSASGDNRSGGDGGSNSGNNGSGSTKSTGSTSSGDGGGFIGNPASSGTGGGCAAAVSKAEQVPLGMYLMIDKSGSMDGQKWTDVTSAIKTFVDQPSAAGIGVGLQFFPLDSGMACGTFCVTNADCGACGPCMPWIPTGICIGAGASTCDVPTYATPAVAIANLPGIGPVIKSSLDANVPSGGTPTSAALDGAITYTKQWMTMNPNAVGVAIFATDGDPSDCDTDLNNINAIAAAGLNGTPSVKTYVIGVGQSLTALNGIAAAGGTGQAFLVDTNGAQDQFLQAMNAIRGAALSCAYLIPPPPMGEMIDYGAINVEYTPDGGMPQVIPQVASPIACPASGLAWYYDSNMPPKQILLCPSTCDQISADSKGQVNVAVGCATVIK